MTHRERVLSVLLLPPLVLFAGGFFAYQLWLEPLRARDKQIADLSAEVDDKLLALRKARDKKTELERHRPVSLPADVDLAGREYAEELSRLLRESGFDASAFSITPKVETKTVPTLPNKKPIYSRLVFTVSAKGELSSLVDFMSRFYKIRLLHQIRNLSVRRPIQAGRDRTNELDVNFTIEALVLDTAEQRKTLLPEKTSDLPAVLASKERDYSAIAGKDIFFGPPPPVETTSRPASTTDFAQFIKFDGFLTHDKTGVATLFDAYNKQEIQVRPRADGDGFRVEVLYSVGGRKRPLRSGKTLDIMDEYGELQHRWLVLKMSEREIFLQDEDSYYVWHLGQWLSELTKLTAEEALAMGLIPAKTATAADKER